MSTIMTTTTPILFTDTKNGSYTLLHISSQGTKLADMVCVTKVREKKAEQERKSVLTGLKTFLFRKAFLTLC